MRLLIKVFIAAFLLGLLLIASGLLLIQYSPQSLLSLSQYVSPYHLVAEEIDIDLSTPSVNISGLQVNSADEIAITLENFSFSTSWKSLEANSQEWVGFAKNGIIHLNKLATKDAGSSSETSAPNISDLHNMLQKANIAVENILIHITDTSSAKLDYLRRPELLQAEEQGLEFSLHYQQNAFTLPLQGTLLSTINNDIPEITLSLPTVDLRAIMSAQNKNKSPLKEQQPASTHTSAKQMVNAPSITNNESSIDWSPLSQLTPLNLIFQSDKIQITQGDITKIRSRISLTNKEGTQRIQQEHTANVALTLNKDIAINQHAALRADWTVLGEKTKGADVDGNTVISLGDNNTSITGKLNINGIIEQDFTLTTSIKKIPATTLSKKTTQQKKELERLIPFKASVQMSLKKNRLTLKNIDINAKDSDLRGSLDLGFDKKIIDVRTVALVLNSKTFIIPQLKKSPASNTSTTTKTIPIDWLNKVKGKGNINVGEIIYRNKSVLENARIQLILNRNKLLLKNITLNTKDSDLSGNLAIDFDKDITDLRAITFDINSKRLVIPRLKTNTESTNSKPIDWLKKMKADGNINIGEVIYNNKKLLSSARAQLTLQKNQLSINNLVVTANNSDINGNVTADLNQKATDLYAITFDLDSAQLVIPNTVTTNKKASTPLPTSKRSTLFTDDVLPTDWLNTVKAEGNINIAKVIRNNEILATNTYSHITLDKDILKLNSNIGGIAGGKSNVSLSINNTNKKLAVSINASAKNIVLEKLGLLPKEELSGGKTHVELSLNSYGVSTKALASHLQGDLLLTVKNGVLATNTIETIGSDLLLKLVNTINPFYKESKKTELECVVIKSKITDGKFLFDDSIAVKTSKMVIIGDGNINLVTEKINIGINPKARAGVGLDVASLTKFIAIQGDLSQPSIGVSGKGTVQSLLSIGVAVSTGGLSLLATKLADTIISGDACKIAENVFTKKVNDTPTNATLN